MLDLHGISRAAFDLVIAEEVTSEAVYNRRYRGLEYPGGQSGPTGGIGYDFGTQSAARIEADWRGRVSEAELKILKGAAGVRGDRAASYVRRYGHMVDISWEVALEEFCERELPHYLEVLEHYCPGASALGPDCKGVLWSIAYNRDASGFVKGGPRYAEMREIRACVARGDLAKIPGLIRSMKRLWPSTNGVYKRREHEALLFEQGLKQSHPEQHAKLATTPPPPDPDVVAQVQQRLRDLGYFDLGAVDGHLAEKGRTESAILAFRHEHDLPLTPDIDDDLLAALARAEPRQVAPAREQATVQDLREQKVETISLTDQVKGWAGKMFGGSTGLGGAGLLAWLTDKATAVSGARDAVSGLGIPAQVWIWLCAAVLVLAVVAGCAVLVWLVAHKIELKRLADYRAGKNT
ncbi:peptidoglycan-binding protein [Bradyrhizobium sp. BR 10261]|uniref:peptidoglycan-binding protein n=1 Tax=Bradyrhizobium sp. BR 10261 TaxID=2749992 RepID=UPI001C64E4E2|nr:peptidoglycan-binding protein [Bradyrhizobium sp. BR 10261]MBW7967592.1 peptidoglycan-binding protein [Bradyrhizobium sp. BR 10261]